KAPNVDHKDRGNPDAVVQNAASGPSGQSTLDWILPSQQGDLAIALELKRARELCTSIWLAHGDILAREREEAACCAVVRANKEKWPSRDLSKDLRDAAAQAYAAADGQSAFEAGQSSKPRQTNLVSTNDLARMSFDELEVALDVPIDSHQAANQRQAFD